METKTLYKVEVGVCLPECHHDYDSYASAYDKKHAYFDENVIFFTDNAKAVEYALAYVMKGVENTYAIVKALEYNPKEIYGEDWYKYVEGDLKQISEQGYLENYQDIFGEDNYNTKHIILDILKVDEKVIKFDFVSKLDTSHMV